jgi:hypothetical protein
MHACSRCCCSTHAPRPLHSCTAWPACRSRICATPARRQRHQHPLLHAPALPEHPRHNAHSAPPRTRCSTRTPGPLRVPPLTPGCLPPHGSRTCHTRARPARLACLHARVSALQLQAAAAPSQQLPPAPLPALASAHSRAPAEPSRPTPALPASARSPALACAPPAPRRPLLGPSRSLRLRRAVACRAPRPAHPRARAAPVPRAAWIRCRQPPPAPAAACPR